MDSDKQRLRFKLSYDGTDFFGWQKQPGDKPTVQGLLEKLLSKIYDEDVSVVGSGRTDRGVHALSQWAHADVPKDRDVKDLRYRLQRMTPASVTIKEISLAPADFHAQISALEKRYVYRLFNRPLANPFLSRFSWHYPQDLEMHFLQEASKTLLGEHDFATFQSQGTPVSSTVRQISHCHWVQKDSGFVDFHIVGSGFLKQMVRNIVGTLMWFHDKNESPKKMLEILSHKDRKYAGPPAPPQGLFLAHVKYPSELDNKCRKL